MTSHISLACLLLLQPVRCAARGSITKAYLDDGSYSGADTTATVAGWGTTSEGGSFPDVLQSVDLKLLTNAKCEKKYAERYRIADSMLCAIGDLKGGEDSCQGDSGGPLFVQQARAFCPPPQRPPCGWEGLRGYPPSFCHASPRTPTPRPPPLGWAGRDGHHRWRCLVGLRLRAEKDRRRLHARVLLPNLDRGDERCVYGEILARDALPAFVPACFALAAAVAAQPAVAACAAHQLRVLRHQYRMPLWWPGRFRPVWVQHTWVGDRDAVLLRGRTDALPFSGGV